MTAPLTPPPHHQPHSVGGWGTPSSGPPVAYGQDEGPGIRAELREAAVIMAAVAAAGALLGLLWLWLAPRVPLVADSDAVYLGDTEGEQAIGIDGTFTLLAVGFGALSALVVFLVRRRGGIPLVAGLAVGGLLGALLAWRLGVWLGPAQDVVAHAKEVGKGVTFDAPLKLEARGALLVWPVTAMLVHLCLTALFGPRDPDPYADLHAYGPYGPPPADGSGQGPGHPPGGWGQTAPPGPQPEDTPPADHQDRSPHAPPEDPRPGRP
ncbi:hypothetical protein OG701_28925 [Streptomyces uncialis]|nr:hypothetical protein [Streptomyces uncialis]MCX4663221.1 hypothetical protein [Streptomyces uncialis]